MKRQDEEKARRQTRAAGRELLRLAIVITAVALAAQLVKLL